MDRTAEPQERDPRARVGSVVEDLMAGDVPGDVRDLQGEAAQLREALANRATIEQAKGMLMSRYGVDADTAFRILKRWSSVSNIKLRVLAEALVDIGVNGLPTPSLSLPGAEDGALSQEFRSFALRGTSHRRHD